MPYPHPDDTAPEKVAALRRAIAACKTCRDLPLGPRPLVQIGTQASILIAGQAPGRRTHLAGRPFDDLSGVRLRSWLGIDEAVFRDSARVAILPMGFCYPGTGRTGDLPPRPECAPLWRKQVLDVLVGVQLTVIIGRYAQLWHLPETAKLTVAEAMQAWQTRWPHSILLPHPSPRNAGWFRRNTWFESDLLPVLRMRVETILNDPAS